MLEVVEAEVEEEEWRVSRDGEAVTCGLAVGEGRGRGSFVIGRDAVGAAARAWAAAGGLEARN